MGVSLQTVMCAEAGRPERVLAQQLGLSRRVIVAWLRQGLIRSEDGLVRKGDRVGRGQALELSLAGALGDWVAPSMDALPILGQGDGWLAIDKPPGMPSHLSMPFETQTALNHLVAHHPNSALAGEDSLQGGLVHRLDNDASGVLLAASSRTQFDNLRQHFTEASVRRIYRARVSSLDGILPSGEGTIDLLLLARGAKVVVDPKGRATRTLWRSLDDHGLLELELQTGHRHQIRVHLARQGWPILGDRLYGGVSAPRLALHCVQLGWDDQSVISDVPECLEPRVS